MELFLQRCVDGLSSGAIYSVVALAIVLVYLAAGTVNLAQGSMGMFSAFVTWKLTDSSGFGWPLLAGIVVGIIVGIVVGAVLERTLVRPVENERDHLPIIIVTLGVFLAVDAFAGYVFTTDAVKLGSPFPSGSWHLGSVTVSFAAVGLISTVLLCSGAVALLFVRTRLGLHMRAAVDSPSSARLVGIRTGTMSMVGWGLAGGLGALGAVLVAPTTLVSTNMMNAPFFMGVAAAALGGFTSALGAVLGGFVIGLVQTMAPAYVPFVDQQLALASVFVVLLLVLLVKPSGLFGQRDVIRL